MENKNMTGASYQEGRQESEGSRKKRTIFGLVLILAAIPVILILGVTVMQERGMYFISLGMICLAILPFLVMFENRRPQARELVLIAVLTAIAVAGRAAFFMTPQFKPVTAIVIIAGIALGAQAGFLTGALSGFVSNFFFGQGPWTPWQMFAFGIIGFLAGVLFHRRAKRQQESRIVVCIFGGLATLFIYGLILDTSSYLMYTSQVSRAALLAIYASGLPFNLIHASSTVIFLYFLYKPLLKKLERVKLKYGLDGI
jgi:energy-coupling factor transport system substrate-specific component